MDVGIVGAGQIGEALATHLTAGGTKVRVAARTPAHAQDVAAKLGASAGTVAEVIDSSDTVVLAVPYEQMEELITAHRDQFAGKVVVDPSNAVALDAEGNLKPFLTGGQSAGGNVAAWLPGTALYVKAFGTLGAAALRDNARREPRVALFFAADDPSAVKNVEQLIRAAGFDPVGIGGLSQVGRIEMGERADLHQYGGLRGRVVDGAEARGLV